MFVQNQTEFGKYFLKINGIWKHTSMNGNHILLGKNRAHFSNGIKTESFADTGNRKRVRDGILSGKSGVLILSATISFKKPIRYLQGPGL